MQIKFAQKVHKLSYVSCLHIMTSALFHVTLIPGFVYSLNIICLKEIGQSLRKEDTKHSVHPVLKLLIRRFCSPARRPLCTETNQAWPPTPKSSLNLSVYAPVPAPPSIPVTTHILILVISLKSLALGNGIPIFLILTPSTLERYACMSSQVLIHAAASGSPLWNVSPLGYTHLEPQKKQLDMVERLF